MRPIGLALVFGDGRYRIEVVARDGVAVVSLGPYEDEDVVAAWRNLAATSGLPLLVRGADGSLDQPYRQLGRLVLGPKGPPARLAVLTGRRPRFLLRRKPAKMPRRPLVHREREIASGRAR